MTVLSPVVADRGVYETFTVRAARHPSETAEYLLTRLLACCLEHTEGIDFSKGLSDPDEPAKAAPKVAVYAHRDVDALVSRLAGERMRQFTPYLDQPPANVPPSSSPRAPHARKTA